jgi:two-component system, NarL family, response regulator DevR
MISVFLLDDHEIVRRGLHDVLESEADIEVVGEAGSAERAAELILSAAPDVAVLDVRLGDGSGVEVCRDVRSQNSSIGCLILTSFDDDEALLEAIMAGASGYVLKQVRTAELLDAIRRVAGGETLLAPELKKQVLARLDGANGDDRLKFLTSQERKILGLLAEGLTNRQIADQMYLAEKTVKNYVSNLLAKLGMSRRTEAAVYAARMLDQRNDSGRRSG